MMATFFCPSCWKEIREEDKKCPYCHADLAGYQEKTFEEKLINALTHPERETVRRAVYILGRLKSVLAVKDLRALFDRTGDPYVKRETLEALDRIGTEEAVDLIRKAVKSDMAIVRRKAADLSKSA
jgi:HEAT repeat protein